MRVTLTNFSPIFLRSEVAYALVDVLLNASQPFTSALEHISEFAVERVSAGLKNAGYVIMGERSEGSVIGVQIPAVLERAA